MAEPITHPFTQAVKAILEAGLPAGTDVFVGRPTRADNQLSYPFVVLWSIPATAVRVDLAGANHGSDVRIQATGVGISDAEAATVLDRVTWLLAGRRVHVDGWRSGQIRGMPVHQPVTKNEDLWWQGQPTYRSWAMFRLSSDQQPVPSES